MRKDSFRRITRLPDESLRKGLSEASEKNIVNAVLEKSGFNFAEVAGKTRRQEIVVTRHLIAYFGTINMRRSTSQIGLLFQKNHATVINSRNAIENWMQSDHEMKLTVIKLAQLIIKNNMKERIQILGAVTGHNRTAVEQKFKTAQLELESRGYEVINPVELVPHDTAHAEAMRMCLKSLLEVSSVAILPCWAGSKGAQVEYMAANALGLKEIRL